MEVKVNSETISGEMRNCDAMKIQPDSTHEKNQPQQRLCEHRFDQG